jgi:hypothetical protein
MEYGYNSEEESIFHSFMQENEKTLNHKLGRRVTIDSESKKIGREVKDVLRRVSSFITFIRLFSTAKSQNATSF